MKALLEKCKKLPISYVLLGLVYVYLFFICFLNLSLSPSFYTTDMYTDIMYSVRAWETKSFFPEGWVFGNQLYIFATPSLAALIYGIVGRPALAMAIATILMSVGIAFSFVWMLKPVFARLEERLVALLFLLAIPAFCDGAIHGYKGWQLLFTMCSYYACYAITAFLCFGCFLRRREALTKRGITMLVLAAIASFAVGMQSLRQTAIMLPPLLAVEGISQLKSLIKEKKIEKQPLLVTAILTVSNLLGLAFVRLLPIAQHEIFGSTELIKKENLSTSLTAMWDTMAGLFASKEEVGMLLLMIVLMVALACIQAKRKNNEEAPAQWGSLIALFAISVAGIAAINALTTMSVRSIYYFMLFPTVGILFAYAYKRWKLGKAIVLFALAIVVVASIKTTVWPAVKEAKNADSNVHHEISDMLVERGYTTIYSGWNQCEDVAIASDGKLTAGFWNVSTDVFNPVMYLCDPSVYDVAPDKCVYYLKKKNLDIALKTAAARGVTMTLVAEYPAAGIWIYEASENLMQPAQ